MRNSGKVCALNALLGVSPAGTVTAAQQIGQGSAATHPLPTVQEVMERYVRAIGGHEVIFRHKSMTVHGTYDIPRQHASLERAAYYKNGKLLYEIRLPNGGAYHEGFDGAIAWQMPEGSPPTLSTGDEIKSKARDADMYYPGHILDYFTTMQVLDIAEFGGHTCYHLKGTNKWGKVNEHFYDTSSGLLIGYRFNSAWRGGAGDESEVFSSYKSFDGWLIPTRAAHRSAQDEQVETTTSVTFDDVADSVFALPAAIQSLLAKKQEP